MTTFAASRRGRVVLTLLAVAALVAVTFVHVPGAKGAFIAKVNNSTNTAATATYFTCKAAALGNTAIAAYPLNDAGTAGTAGTMADVSGNKSNGTYTATGVTYGAAGPCPRDTTPKAITLDGKAGFAYGPSTYNPSVFSLEIWFKTSVGGGKLIGLGSAQTGNSGNYDRHIYMSSTGALYFGVYPGAVKTINSTATYVDNKWHQVVATEAGSSDANPGIRLYVDGALVASDSTVTGNENLAEYLRIGEDNLNGWTGATTNYFFTGSLAWASLYSTVALTPAQIKSHYYAGM